MWFFMLQKCGKFWSILLSSINLLFLKSSDVVILILLINHTANNQIHLWQWWECHLSIWLEKFRTGRSVESVFRTDLSWRSWLRKRNVPRSGLLCLWSWMGRYNFFRFHGIFFKWKFYVKKMTNFFKTF